MSQHKIEVSVADKIIKVACPAGQETALLSAAKELNGRLDSTRTSSTIHSTDQALMMTALNLANDLLLLQESVNLERQQTRDKIQLLQSSIEQALIEQKNNFHTKNSK
jgi:cell division protein ZapA